MEVYQVDEPQGLLANTYLNHAHNDLLEVLLTGGVPGAALLIVAVVGWLIASRRAFLRGGGGTFGIRRAGVVILGLMFAASLFDYPLRVPSLEVLAVIAGAWSNPPRRRFEKAPRVASGDELANGKLGSGRAAAF